MPCMFQSTATDGNSASYIGLLIRPSNSATVTQAPSVIPAVVAPSINVQKAHVVPQTVLKIPYTQKPAKGTDVQSGVFRLQSTTTACSTAPQCDPWMQRNSGPNVPATFDSSSTSQVIPQMHTGDSYNSVSCPSTSSFFPPIASIAQGFSSGKSSTDLLQDSSPVSRVSSQKLQSSYCDYTQNTTQRYTAVTVPDNRFTQLPVEIPSNRLTSSCKYQSGYTGTNDCSATPDSGIQSIGDSPRSIGPFVTPMPSPASFVPMTCNDVNDPANQQSTSYDDYSDMPRLVPYHQMEESCSSNSDEAPQITDTTRSENEETGHEVPKIAITPSVNVNDLVEQLMSHLGPEQRKQFADAIKSKVVDEFDPGNCATTSQVSPPTDGSVEEETWDPMTANDLEQQHSISGKGFLQCEEMQSPVPESDSFYDREMSLERKDDEPWSAQKVEEFNRNNGMPSLENEQQELCEDEISFICQLRADVSEEETKKRKDISTAGGVSENFYDEGSSSESSPKERVVDLDFAEGSTPGFEKNEDSLPTCRDENFEVRPKASVDFKDEKKPKKRRTSIRQERSQGKKVKLKDAAHAPGVRVSQKTEKIAEKKIPAFLPRRIVEVPVECEERIVQNSTHGEMDSEGSNTRQKLEEDTQERIRAFRLKVKKQMSEQLNGIIDRVEKQFASIELELGPRMHWELPWYRLNWKEVAQRIAERSRIEKLAREKHKVTRSTKRSSSTKGARRALPKKSISSSVSDVQSTKAQPSSDNKQDQESYTNIKHNAIVDAYPKPEQATCSCKTGCCGEDDQCCNRMIRMECSSSCRRGKQCVNRRIQRRECAAKIETFKKSTGSATGVRVHGDVKKGQFVGEYVGEVVSVDTFNSRKQLYATYRRHHALNLCPGFVIDSHRKGNLARFINHSCSPNCELQQWSVNGQYRIGIFALQDISKGEEITYDYGKSAYDAGDMTECTCSASNCRRFLKKSVTMSKKEKKIANKNRLLLLRNVEKSAKRKIAAAQERKSQDDEESSRRMEYLTALREYVEEISSALSDFGSLSKRQFNAFHSSVTSLLTQPSADRIESLLPEVEVELQNTLDLVSKSCDKKRIETLKTKLFAIRSKYADRLRKYGVLPQSFEEKPQGGKRKLHAHRILTATTNLSYLDSGVPVGSYDPDEISHLSTADADSDCVRCICGITDDDGSMIQCDSCHFWLHDDCVYWSKPSTENAEFTCDFCKTGSKRTAAISIPLRPQPEIKFAGCTYYRTLVNTRNLQVRLNETVYTQKLANDDHKAELKRLSEAPKDSSSVSRGDRMEPSPSTSDDVFQPTSFPRKDLRCFRVERLFVSPEGHKFVFGWHYARPHEVYCEPGRMFHKNELFATSMFDTIPLDAVVGRCLAVEPRVYCLGRPKMPRYNEADVYFYEFQQTGKNSRYFEKISSKNHYYINTGPHNFVRFPKPVPLERNFTPFVLENSESCRNTPPPQSESVVSSSRRHRSGSRRSQKNQVARLEKLVQKLTDQTCEQHISQANAETTKRDSSPPQKRTKQ